MSNHPAKGLSLAVWWILFCALCSLAGWGLSAIHQLNATGYLLTFLLAFGALLLWSKRTGRSLFSRPSFSRLRRRFGRPLPLAFLMLAALAFAGGALYAPNNWDALAYRVPRVLHWLAEGRWHWIHTTFQRVNMRGCGFEWVMAPILALTKTDRLLFLINFISFCFFPGVFFTSLRCLGVKARVAYCWMWILPSGYCFLLQAASLGNDFLPAFFALAAFAYGLRARQAARAGRATGAPGHGSPLGSLWLSMLAIALSTGVKANHLPLGLLWMVVVAPCWRLPRTRPVVTLAVCVVSLAVSFFPTALLNQLYLGDWTGIRADGMGRAKEKRPVTRILANTGVVLLQNFAPPLAPFAASWNRHIAPRLASSEMNQLFEQEMCRITDACPLFRMQELPMEETAGLGLGVCALLLLSTVAAFGAKLPAREPTPPQRRPRLRRWVQSLTPAQRWIFGAIAATIAAFLALSLPNSDEARLMSAYYPILVIPLLALPGQARIVRRRWWSMAALLVAVMAALPLALSPARPLIPVPALVKALRERGCSGPLLERTEKAYSVYSQRAVALAPVLVSVPRAETRIGFVSFNNPEASLWKPFGSRSILHVCPEDTAEQLRANKIRYLVVDESLFPDRSGTTFSEWSARIDAETVRTFSINLLAREDATVWHLVRLR
jgi:hypothetical protein